MLILILILILVLILFKPKESSPIEQLGLRKAWSWRSWWSHPHNLEQSVGPIEFVLTIQPTFTLFLFHYPHIPIKSHVPPLDYTLAVAN